MSLHLDGRRIAALVASNAQFDAVLGLGVPIAGIVLAAPLPDVEAAAKQRLCGADFRCIFPSEPKALEPGEENDVPMAYPARIARCMYAMGTVSLMVPWPMATELIGDYLERAVPTFANQGIVHLQISPQVDLAAFMDPDHPGPDGVND